MPINFILPTDRFFFDISEKKLQKCPIRLKLTTYHFSE